MDSACNSRSAVAPAFLPKVPNDGHATEDGESVGVLMASWHQLSPTFAIVLPGSLWSVQCGAAGSLGSICGDALTHRLSAST